MYFETHFTLHTFYELINFWMKPNYHFKTQGLRKIDFLYYAKASWITNISSEVSCINSKSNFYVERKHHYVLLLSLQLQQFIYLIDDNYAIAEWFFSNAVLLGYDEIDPESEKCIILKVFPSFRIRFDSSSQNCENYFLCFIIK